jgi:hypothetical protein
MKEDLFPPAEGLMSQFNVTRPGTQVAYGKHNRKSTFSQYYLNKRTKDLLSVRSGLVEPQNFDENPVD